MAAIVTQRIRRGMLAMGVAVLAGVLGPPSAGASDRVGLVISTSKPIGPTIGQFSTSGAFTDSGALITLRPVFGALPAPFGVIANLTLRFEGNYGTFTIQAHVLEKVTADPQVFADEGTWVVIDGTGAYATLRGNGSLDGTVNDATGLIKRVFSGSVHFN